VKIVISVPGGGLLFDWAAHLVLGIELILLRVLTDLVLHDKRCWHARVGPHLIGRQMLWNHIDIQLNLDIIPLNLLLILWRRLVLTPRSEGVRDVDSF
jgi:hypothetical protein